MTTQPPGFRPVPLSGGDIVKSPREAASITWVRRIADAVNGYILKGKLNCVVNFTLSANEDSTVVVDERISVFSALLLNPLTAHAAAAMYESPYIITDVVNGQVTFNHVNDAYTDKDFNLVIMG